MFFHIVLLKFNEKADDSFHREAQQHAKRVKRECSDLVLFHLGENLASRSRGYSHTLVSSFTNSEAHDRYQSSDVHQEMKRFLAPYTDSMVVHDGNVPAILPPIQADASVNSGSDR
jgi:hypothetical protein